MITRPRRLSKRGRIWALLGVMSLPAVVWTLISGISALEDTVVSAFEGPPPSQSEIVAMLAEVEGVPRPDINLHVVDISTEHPHILYSIENVPESATADRLPVVERIMVHPRWDPWSWVVAGGSRSEARDPGEAATFGFTSASGDLSSEVNTVIYGLTAPDVAEVHVTIRGETYVRDVRDTNGYLILLSHEGVPIQAVTGVRVLDMEGNELASPVWW